MTLRLLQTAHNISVKIENLVLNFAKKELQCVLQSAVTRL